MGQIVRRKAQSLAVSESADNLLPPKTHRTAGIFVTSQVALGIEPKLFLSWAVVPSYWAKGYTLLVFHSTSEFSSDKYPDDLNRHGRLIIETSQDESREVHPEEGTHYYTFLLHKKYLLGLSEKMSVLRFSETIPSAKVAIGRIKDKLELEEMRRRHELGEIEHEAKLNETEVRRIRSRERLAEAENPKEKRATGFDLVISDELAGIDAMIDSVFAKRTKVEDVKKDPRFKKLSRKEKKAILERIEERMDAGEISARRDMRG